jgi:hypothetical protein
MDTLFQRMFVGVFIFMVLLATYAYFDRGRTLECRTQAQTNGVTVIDSIALCKR